MTARCCKYTASYSYNCTYVNQHFNIFACCRCNYYDVIPISTVNINNPTSFIMPIHQHPRITHPSSPAVLFII